MNPQTLPLYRELLESVDSFFRFRTNPKRGLPRRVKTNAKKLQGTIVERVSDANRFVAETADADRIRFTCRHFCSGEAERMGAGFVIDFWNVVVNTVQSTNGNAFTREGGSAAQRFD